MKYLNNFQMKKKYFFDITQNIDNNKLLVSVVFLPKWRIFYYATVNEVTWLTAINSSHRPKNVRRQKTIPVASKRNTKIYLQI